MASRMLGIKFGRPRFEEVMILWGHLEAFCSQRRRRALPLPPCRDRGGRWAAPDRKSPRGTLPALAHEPHTGTGTGSRAGDPRACVRGQSSEPGCWAWSLEGAGLVDLWSPHGPSPCAVFAEILLTVTLTSRPLNCHRRLHVPWAGNCSSRAQAGGTLYGGRGIPTPRCELPLCCTWEPRCSSWGL